MTGEIAQIPLDNEYYPKLLVQIPDPPKKLYCRGNLNLLDSECFAVLGGGVSDPSIGPKINLRLAQNIIKSGGLLVSEYSEKESIFPANFAVRDRIISGLCKGVLIIEAGEGSGA